MSKREVHNFYFGSDIFNLQKSQNNTKIGDNIKDNNLGSSSNRKISNFCNNKLNHKVDNIPKETKGLTSKGDGVKNDEHLLKYDPNYYFNKSSFAKEQKARIQRHKSQPRKEPVGEYNENVVKFRKYGSSFSIKPYSEEEKPKLKLKQRSISVNNSLSSFRDNNNKTSREVSIHMNRSNIFNLEHKENQNNIQINDAVQRSKTPNKSANKESQPQNKNHGRNKRRIDKTFSKENDIQLVNQFFNNKTSSTIANHVNMVSTLYDNQFYPKTYGKKHKMTDGVIHKYEISKTNDYNVIDTNTIKEMFRNKGINVFGAEYHDSFSYGKQKCIMRIRTNENDINQMKNIQNVINEIENSKKVNFQKITEQNRTMSNNRTTRNKSIKIKNDTFNKATPINQQE